MENMWTFWLNLHKMYGFLGFSEQEKPNLATNDIEGFLAFDCLQHRLFIKYNLGLGHIQGLYKLLLLKEREYMESEQLWPNY